MSIIGFKIGSTTERYNYPNLDSIPTPDTTLSQSGKFPDSKTVGDKFKAITEN